MKATVPLVIYKGVERIVVGEATLVSGSGSDIVVDARISDDYIRTLLEPTPEFSMGAWAKRVEEVSCLDQSAKIPTDIQHPSPDRSLLRYMLVSDKGPGASEEGRQNQTERGQDSSSL